MECIKVEALSFRYPGSDKYCLHDISFSVSRGEFVTVCGLSGSSKSTLLRQLKTSLQPHGDRSGNIFFDGKPLSEADLREQSSRIGFVMQSPDDQSITDKVWHELAFGLESLGVSSSEIQRRSAELASFFGIEHWLNCPVSKLSGGEKQILNLASVMIMRPSLLILDEPIAQLDPIAAGKFISMLIKINRELGVTVIMSSHELDSVFSESSRIIVLSDGRISADDTPQNIARILFEKKEPVFLSLPDPTRIYEHLDPAGAQAPLSVSDGRRWLEGFMQNNKASDIPKKPPITHSDKPCIEAKELWFRYERSGEDILKGLSLSIYKGEYLTILGGNGTGKTTLLSVICGAMKCYRGRTAFYEDGKKTSGAKIALLPQDPRTLFVKTTVEAELMEMPGSASAERLMDTIKLCELGGLLKRHPYDLSGGEQQRAALAKLLLTDPDIILLDEPTKGLDAAYKRRLAGIIKALTQNGRAVVAVSHDLEFCAMNSDRCVMLFDGRIVSDDTPQSFFSSNGIYTTSVSRMSQGMISNAVTADELLSAFSSETDESSFLPPENNNTGFSGDDNKEPSGSRSPKKLIHLIRTGFTLISFIVFVTTLLSSANILSLPFLSENTVLSYSLLFMSAAAFLFSLGRGSRRIAIVKGSRSIKRSIVTLITVFFIVPLTVIAGVYLLDNTKYLFISLLVMLESIVPFYIMFEKRTVHTRELVIIAALCALCVTGRAVFYMLPAFKPVTAIVIISAAALGSESGFMIGSVSMLVSNIFFGQGIWTPWQMLAMGLIGFIAGELFNRRLIPASRASLSFYGIAACYLLYGGIMNPAALILSGSPVTPGALLSVYGLGLPIDTVHALSTAVFLFIGSEAVINKLERIKLKYSLIL